VTTVQVGDRKNHEKSLSVHLLKRSSLENVGTLLLCTYKSNAPGILVRHVLEHNYDWEKILSSAIQSFQRKLCLILFTPFAEQTAAIVHDRKIEIDVPDLSFRREDIEAHFEGLAWRLVTLDKPHALYRVEHLYFVWRE
jgi:hypothetical protein